MQATQEARIDPRESYHLPAYFTTGVLVIPAKVEEQGYGIPTHPFGAFSPDPPLAFIPVNNQVNITPIWQPVGAAKPILNLCYQIYIHKSIDTNA